MKKMYKVSLYKRNYNGDKTKQIGKIIVNEIIHNLLAKEIVITNKYIRILNSNSISYPDTYFVLKEELTYKNEVDIEELRKYSNDKDLLKKNLEKFKVLDEMKHVKISKKDKQKIKTLIKFKDNKNI